MIRALVLRAPGINCDRETAHACQLAGFTADLVHINQLIKDPERLLDYRFLALPGGFSYGDDLGAGTLLARKLMIYLGEQLRRFIEEGRPVLGVCNGFQVLVKSGLLAGTIEEGKRAPATLTENALAQFECRWIALTPQPSACIFTRGLEYPIELPVAHGEGQFVFKGNIAELQTKGQVPLVYASRAGYSGHPGAAEQSVVYPDNPNGSPGNIAAICNQEGNVLGLMPHPERYVQAFQHPQRRALSGGEGDGLLIFKNAYTYASELTLNHKRSYATGKSTGTSAYAASGVNIDAADLAKRMMQKAVQETQGSDVLAGVGAFAGILDAQKIQKMRRPALAASTDGVGTKTLLAAQAGRFDTIGHDIVNHCVNDLLVQGGQPLFFMDYLAVSKLDPVPAARIVKSVAEACKEAGCTLLGGETAEMPDVYMPGAFDLAGTIVGLVEQEEIINGSTICAGDVLLGLPSSGLHTNGYSLARHVFASFPPDAIFPELGESLADALLRPHRSYLREITLLREYLADRGRFIKGMAHITGGGFEGNISRILPAGTQAVIETGAWEVPAIFKLLARLGHVEREEQYRTLNMGIGMVIALSPKGALDARCVLPELLSVGYITEGEGVVLR
ncbi:phosphoribosylformylglycinamidine cyclo-ligase [Ktedonosporobacter rubrisoli]|uniref:Phosphoribosylformylglycinamidine cyclo-ligase n=1 Tax=Ktedonosporobacter rubrisoli TaxID=2509675 RepID=A0A4P6JWY6_KTERU|nr:phosphoribosylformylglycinamidine cyclo-ligase [Ktedonosporobacter rubrisoli]QBD80239.1 phosphoribosylformylglycinamidine cyclo-ligase [Ktedonosporobacter rubrisoli]